MIGAWQIYEHSGNLTFLSKSYEFYKELFWNGIGGNHFGYGYDSVLCLNKMADVLGFPEDAIHWNSTGNIDNVQNELEYFWEIDTPGMYGGNEGKFGWTNIATAALSMFPREWVDIMAREWMDNPVEGFFGEVPLTTIPMKDWEENNFEFAVVPDANWYMIRALYIHTIDALANKFTIAHLKKYNMEWGIPFATEGRYQDSTLFGDRFSNFNAGKILLILEGIGGIHYSTHEDSFTFADNLPLEWSFMEFHVPVQSPEGDETWVKVRSEREQKDGEEEVKIVTVESNPFKKLIVQPWLEDANVVSSYPSGEVSDPPVGHMSS